MPATPRLSGGDLGARPGSRPGSGARRRGAPAPEASPSRVGLLSADAEPELTPAKPGLGGLSVVASSGGPRAAPAPDNPGLLRAVPQWWRIAKLWFQSE
jgi:hypothetical protein